MNRFCKKLIVALIAVGLLFGVNASKNSAFFSEKLALIDQSFDQENSKNQNCEIEDLKFFDQKGGNFTILKISLNPGNKNDIALQQNFSVVPTSPPNC